MNCSAMPEASALAPPGAAGAVVFGAGGGAVTGLGAGAGQATIPKMHQIRCGVRFIIASVKHGGTRARFRREGHPAGHRFTLAARNSVVQSPKTKE
jgi:hypothetical protein